MKYELKCENCGDKFKSSQSHKKTCSDECRKIRYREFYGINNAGLPSQFLGKLNEYKVMVDLGLRGYDIFYSAFPQQHYDLIIQDRDNGELYKVEVKTGYEDMNGKINKPKHTHEDWDIMAVVITAKKKIVYFEKRGKLKNAKAKSQK